MVKISPDSNDFKQLLNDNYMDTAKLRQEETANEVSKKNSKNLFSFEGRIRRRSYWIQYFICNIIIGILSEASENGIDDGGLIIFFVIFYLSITPRQHKI